MEPIVINTAGHSKGNMVCDSVSSRCGQIENGIGLYWSTDNAGWVVSFEDWERVYLAAKKWRESEL